jgi:hypothetical protein
LALPLHYPVPEAEMDDRRKSERFRVAEGITGLVRPTMEIRVLNISQHGILLEAPAGLPPDGVCELTLNAPSGKKKIRARVARCRAHMIKGDKGAVKVVFHAGLEFPEEYAASNELKDLMTEICVVEDSAAPRPVLTGHLEQAM